ncbi:MAG TPA: FAD-dependent oxidoreductase, partial [Actinopolymorphaceae bacterium]|nr:FAD-dependent oxidoreductase [Actinopolymorphaceae bacterium]
MGERTNGSEPCEVLVVGAGPTGLAMAVDLARRGIDVRVIDRAGTHRSGSRAHELDPRTLEILRDLGVAGPVLADATA